MKKTFDNLVLEYCLILLAASSFAFNIFKAFIMTESQRNDVLGLLILSAVFLFILHLCSFYKAAAVVISALTAAVLVIFGIGAFLSKPVTVNTMIQYLHTLLTVGSCIAVFFAVKSKPGNLLLLLIGGGALFFIAIEGFELSLAAYLLFMLSVTVLYFTRNYMTKMRGFAEVKAGKKALSAIAVVIVAVALVGSQVLYGSGLRFGDYDLNVSTVFNVQADKSNVGTAVYQNSSYKTLGKPVKPDNSLVMEVKADSPFYIRGSVYGDYMGNCWNSSISGDFGFLGNYSANLFYPFPFGSQTIRMPWYNYFWMFGYTYYADREQFLRLNPTDYSKYITYYQSGKAAISIQTLKATYKVSGFKNIFIPLDYLSLEYNAKQITGTTNNNELTLSAGTSYSLTYSKFDMTSPQIQEILKNDAVLFSSIRDYLGKYQGSTPLSAEFENNGDPAFRPYGSVEQLNYVNYTEQIQYVYSKPGPTTQRVKDLATQITKDCTTDYDKVTAIKDYLSKGYKYTLKPKQPPAGQDVVDYFLFDSKQGYCQHFATAMTVMLRAAGVPCRYVDGYVSPATSKNGVYKVTNDQAHAWVEVYSKTLGFYTVEATPGFAYTDSAGAFTGVQNRNGSDVSSEEENASSEDTGVGSSSGVSSVTSSGGHAQKTHFDVRTLLPYIPAFIILLITLVFAGKKAYRVLWRARMKKLAGSDRILILYGYYRKVLSKLGLTGGPGDTPYEFAASVKDKIGFGGHDFTAITSIFVAARYSGEEISEEELRRFLAFDHDFEKYCRKYAGTLRYLSEYLLF